MSRAWAVAGVLFLFLFNPSLGLFVHALRALGLDWNHALNGNQALTLVILAAAFLGKARLIDNIDFTR